MKLCLTVLNIYFLVLFVFYLRASLGRSPSFNFAPNMAAEKDDVLSLESGSETEFAGFGPEDICSRGDEVVTKKNKGKSNKVKSLNEPTTSTSSSTRKGNKTVSAKCNSAKESSAGSASTIQAKENSSKGKPAKAKKNVMDIENLSDSDIQKLKELLGFEQTVSAEDESDFQYLFAQDLSNLPNMHVEVDNDGPYSDTEIIPATTVSSDSRKGPLRSLENDISGALFDSCSVRENTDSGNDEYFWQLPKLKIPEKGEAISQSLASLINTACTSQCETDGIVSKYKLPENCDKLAPPLINGEIWNEIHKKAQTYDRAFRDIQGLIASGMIPIIKLASLLKDQIKSNEQAKTMFSDSITLFGQAQYNLSLRRRYMIRPFLKKKYSNLCNLNTPITTSLFGDDVQKEIKKCDTSLSVAKDQYGSYGPQRFRGRVKGRGMPSRGYGNYGNYGYGNYQGGRGYNRFQPYGRQPVQYRYPTQYQIPKKAKKPTTSTEDVVS